MSKNIIPRVCLPDGKSIPAIGQGTWRMGESQARAAAEIRALRAGIEYGLSLIDTAEMYAAGGAERIVGQAVHGERESVFLVSKVSPQNASARGIEKANAASLKRLETDVIDLYLLHWPGPHPIGETVAAFETLRAAGRIRYWGVSNFDVAAMEAVAALPAGAPCAANQVLYHPDARGIEFDLLPWCRARHMPVMAYSPLGQAGKLLRWKALAAVGERHGVSAAQIALAWSVRDGNTIAIPKASSLAHLQENVAAAGIKLTQADLAEIDAAHKPPRAKTGLEML